jgi:lipopolysaccharide export system permease protein
MIFRRSLVRELTATAIGLFVVLLAILFTQSVIRILARAAGGAVAADGVLALIGFNAMFYLNLLTFGQSLTACLKPILLFAAPFLVAIVLLSLFLSPWAEQRKIEFERQLESRDEISILSPGLFREFKRAGIVVYVESINPVDGRIRNVFLHSVDDAKDATTVARLGHLVEEPNGDRFVVLEDGRRYEGKPGAADFRLIEFDKLGRRIEPAEARALPSSNKAIPTAALLVADGRGERAELFWRLSVPILALVLTLLAIPLAYVNPRMGRSFNLIAAAFLYMLYTNCINIVQSMIAQGTLDLWVGLLVPHVAALMVVFLLFRHQLSITGLFGRRTRAVPA